MATAALVPLAAAHGSTGLPKVMGLDHLDTKARSLFANFKAESLFDIEVQGTSSLEPRKDDRECGEGIGSCPQDKCCSVAGCT